MTSVNPGTDVPAEIKEALRLREKMEKEPEKLAPHVEPKVKCTKCGKEDYPIYALSAPAIVYCSICGEELGLDYEIEEWIYD